MKRIPTEIVKNRTRRLTQLFDTILPYEGRIGQEYEVLVTEVASDKKHLVGHNKFYEQILVPNVEGYMGAVLRVRITETGKHFMKAEVLQKLKTGAGSGRSPLTYNVLTGLSIGCALAVFSAIVFWRLRSIVKAK